MKRYRVEIFDRSLNYVSHASVAIPNIAVDYLVPTTSTVTVPQKLLMSKGDYCQVKDDTGWSYQGIISDYTYDRNTTTITLTQMYELLDVEVFADVSTMSAGIETWLIDRLREVYDGNDEFQKLAGLTMSTASVTYGTYPVNDDGIYNLYDIVTYMFKVYGIICTLSFDASIKKTYIRFKLVDSVNIWKIETKIKDVLNYSVKSASMMDSANKMIIRNADDPTQEVIYFWHPTEFAGTVDSDGTTNRVLPVRLKCATVQVGEDETFADVSLETAIGEMYQSRYDDQIEIMFNSQSKLVEVGDIGQLYTVIDGDNQYNTMLTGYQINNEKNTTMVFGFVRQRLTQILQLERRKK